MSIFANTNLFTGNKNPCKTADHFYGFTGDYYVFRQESGKRPSVFRFHIEVTPDFGGLNGVDKSLRIGFPHSFQSRLDIGAGDDGVDHSIWLMAVRTLDHRDGCAMVTGGVDDITDLLGVFGDNEQRLFLIAAVKCMECLRGDILEDDGIQSAFPAKEKPGNGKNDDIEAKHQVPGLDTPFLRKVNSDEIGAAAGGVGPEAETDRGAAENSAEDSDQQDVISDRKPR